MELIPLCNSTKLGTALQPSCILPGPASVRLLLLLELLAPGLGPYALGLGGARLGLAVAVLARVVAVHVPLVTAALATLPEPSGLA